MAEVGPPNNSVQRRRAAPVILSRLTGSNIGHRSDRGGLSDCARGG